MECKRFLTTVALAVSLTAAADEAWTLRRCVDYALENNTQVKQSRVAEEEGDWSLWQQRGKLFPSLSFSTSQTLGYRPFETSTAIVQNGQVTNTTSKVTYQGSYGLNASVTLWNGGINQKNIEAQRLQNQITELATQQSEQSIEEQVAQLYVQILYTKEALEVNKALSATAKQQLERAEEMLRQGQLSKADVAQLEAQWRSTEYDVVSSETQIANFKRQLKSLLQLPMGQAFDVAGQEPAEELVMEALPSAESVYAAAVATRPEIKSAELAIDAADLQLDIAKRGYLPTIGASASVGTSHYSASDNSYGQQFKTNLNMSAGVTVSVPIFDQRSNKTSVEKAKLSKVTSQIQLDEQKTSLQSTIESLWLDAHSNQQKYLSAKEKTRAQQESYDLLNEQYKNGLKNIVELLQGRDNLVSAKQDELQSKYTALLNIQLLKFYAGETINL